MFAPHSLSTFTRLGKSGPSVPSYAAHLCSRSTVRAAVSHTQDVGHRRGLRCAPRKSDIGNNSACYTNYRTLTNHGSTCTNRRVTAQETAPLTNAGLAQLAFLATAARLSKYSGTSSTTTVHITRRTAVDEARAHPAIRVRSSHFASAQITKEHLCSDLLSTSANGTARPCFTCFCF